MTTLLNKSSHRQRLGMNQRLRAFMTIIIGSLIVISITVAGFFLDEERITTNLLERNLPPSFQNFFGTDWLGRDMFSRTVMGLSLSA